MLLAELADDWGRVDWDWHSRETLSPPAELSFLQMLIGDQLNGTEVVVVTEKVGDASRKTVSSIRKHLGC